MEEQCHLGVPGAPRMVAHLSPVPPPLSGEQVTDALHMKYMAAIIVSEQKCQEQLKKDNESCNGEWHGGGHGGWRGGGLP